MSEKQRIALIALIGLIALKLLIPLLEIMLQGDEEN